MESGHFYYGMDIDLKVYTMELTLTHLYCSVGPTTDVQAYGLRV